MRWDGQSSLAYKFIRRLSLLIIFSARDVAAPIVVLPIVGATVSRIVTEIKLGTARSLIPDEFVVTCSTFNHYAVRRMKYPVLLNEVVVDSDFDTRVATPIN